MTLGERYETGVVDIHLAVFLTIEWEFEWKIYGYIVVEHVVAQCALFALTVGLDVFPLEFH